jgi:hypothetical protein
VGDKSDAQLGAGLERFHCLDRKPAETDVPDPDRQVVIEQVARQPACGAKPGMTSALGGRL